jgi:hypothetical protein
MMMLKLAQTAPILFLRSRKRIFQPANSHQRSVFQANSSKFTLINRLKARNRHNPSASVSMLYRAIFMIQIICTDCFTTAEKPLISPLVETLTNHHFKSSRLKTR